MRPLATCLKHRRSLVCRRRFRQRWPHLVFKHQSRARLPWIGITTPQPLMLNIDGEPVTGTRFRIDCVPRRLRVVLPEDSPLLSAGVALAS